jgi:hypothetical protein
VPRLVARAQSQPRPKTDAAISKTSTCGENVERYSAPIAVESLQLGLCADAFQLHGQAEEGQRGCGASVSMPPTRRPGAVN